MKEKDKNKVEEIVPMPSATQPSSTLVATPVPSNVPSTSTMPVASAVAPQQVVAPMPAVLQTSVPVQTPVATVAPTVTQSPVQTPVATVAPTVVQTPVQTPVATAAPTVVQSPVQTPVATAEPSTQEKTSEDTNVNVEKNNNIEVKVAEKEVEEPIEMLEGACVQVQRPEDEQPEEEVLDTSTIQIEGEETKSVKEEIAPPPVVAKVENSPIANAEVKKVEKAEAKKEVKKEVVPEVKTVPKEVKKEPVKKEEIKKEDKKKKEKKVKEKKEVGGKDNNKVAIIVIIVALVVAALFSVKTFVLDANPAENSSNTSNTGEKDTSTEEPIDDAQITDSEAKHLLSMYLVHDGSDSKFNPIERFTKGSTVYAPDISNNELFYIAYNNGLKNKTEFTLDELNAIIDEMFVGASYDPQTYQTECMKFNYDEATKSFKKEDVSCSVDPRDDDFVYDSHNYISNKIENIMTDEVELRLTVGVYFGRGDDETKESLYYSDFERTNPVDTTSLQMNGNVIVQIKDNFENSTKYDFVFKSKDGKYSFDRVEISQ